MKPTLAISIVVILCGAVLTPFMYGSRAEREEEQLEPRRMAAGE